MNLTLLSKCPCPLFFHSLASSGPGIVHESRMNNLDLFPAILISDSKGEAHCADTKATYTHTHNVPKVRWFDPDLTLCSLVCQLNNGLAGIKASQCHNYTPAVINPMCINVGTVRTVEQRYLFYISTQETLVRPQKHTHSFWENKKKNVSGTAEV